MNPVEMRDVFVLLGLEEDWSAMTDRQPTYRFKSDMIDLTAAELLSTRSFSPVFHLGGVVRTKRTLKQISFDCPLTVDGVEQGVALLAHAIGDDGADESSPSWLILGRKWQDRLPWRKSPTK